MKLVRIQKRKEFIRLFLETGRIDGNKQKHYICFATQRSNYKRLKDMFDKDLDVLEDSGYVVAALKPVGTDSWVYV